MNAFESARAVEAQSLAILMPFLQERSYDGQFVVTNKGRLAPFLQEIVGDALLNTDEETVWSVEIKAENRFTGNLFLETWSNRNLQSAQKHAQVGSNIGWLYKSRADLLLYHFLSNDSLYVFDLFRLKRWAFAEDSSRDGLTGRLFDFQEFVQRKYAQANETCGRIVPLAVLAKEVGYRLLYPRQVTMYFADADVA